MTTVSEDELGDVLDQTISLLGLSQQEAADRVGITDRHLRRMRNGEYPYSAIEALRKLGCEVDVDVTVDVPENGT